MQFLRLYEGYSMQGAKALHFTDVQSRGRQLAIDWRAGAAVSQYLFVRHPIC